MSDRTCDGYGWIDVGDPMRNKRCAGCEVCTPGSSMSTKRALEHAAFVMEGIRRRWSKRASNRDDVELYGCLRTLARAARRKARTS